MSVCEILPNLWLGDINSSKNNSNLNSKNNSKSDINDSRISVASKVN